MVPFGTLMRVPFGTLMRVPFGTLIRVPFGTLIRVPLGTLIRVPFGTLIRVPFGTLIRVPLGTLIRAPRGSRKPPDSRGLREPGRTGVPAVHACPEGVQGLHALQTGVHGQHACPAGPHAKPAVLTPFVGVRTACGMRGFARLVGKACSPRTPFFLGVRGGVRTPFGCAAIKPPTILLLISLVRSPLLVITT
ncbi:hypothetical protein PCANC_23752 [Puccinia coronata f. sp. avenae]|uniref:Uncharacterized protein n=1 Tax=Puccinia coronata f. sp. avenae TaxID=200324 RepID=A0A2N5UAX7_9BASI|nr:hypothetical protein PCANC_23752 [Puccinia coronata f. sp. avenae]